MIQVQGSLSGQCGVTIGILHLAKRMSLEPIFYIMSIDTCHHHGRLASRHTNASSGIVVNMLRPNASRAILISTLSAGKLFKILPM